MSASKERLKDLALSWKANGEAVASAISARSYEECRKASSSSASSFSTMSDLIDKEPELLEDPELRELLLAGVEVWRANVEAMPEWMSDVKQELDGVRRKLSSGRKIGGAYGAFKKSCGLKLKIKAR